MTKPFVNEPVQLATDDERPRASALGRLAALVAGLLLLVAGTVVSSGVVLLGPIAMALGASIQRRRGRRLSRAGG